MVRFTVMTVIAAYLCVDPSLSLPDMNEFEVAASGFEDVPNSNSEIEPNSLFLEDEVSDIQPDIAKGAIVKRQSPCVGCIDERNITDPAIIEAFNIAWNLMPDKSEHEDVKLVRATSQVLNGIKYTFYVRANWRTRCSVLIPEKCELELFFKEGYKPDLINQKCVNIR